MAANENFRLADLNLPNFDVRNYSNPNQVIGELVAYLGLLNQVLIDRDNEIKNKVNQLHVEYVTAAPSDAPDEPEPVFRIYNNGGTIYLYVYINSAWKSVQLA